MKFLATTAVVKILEVSSAFYPEKNGLFNPSENFILPTQNTSVQFGGNAQIVCGPSPFINTMNCFGTKFLHYAKSVPIPGGVSTTPIFHENSWVIGTTKGFLFRVKAVSTKNSLPSIESDNTELWGFDSREVMDAYVPKTIYKESTGKLENEENAPLLPKNYFWIFPTSSPFVGTPVVKHGMVYALTANQTLQAINFTSGKLVWSVRVAPDVSFFLENLSLRVMEKEVLIGTNRGTLLVLDPFTGNQIGAVTISSTTDQENHFPGIVAPPLVEGSHAVVSNAISSTQKISLETFEAAWTYPSGSITTPLLFNESTLILTTSNGKIVSLNAHTGAVNWSTNLDKNSPLVDTVFTNNKKTLLTATKRGELIALDSTTGKVLTENRPIGTVIGFFFTTDDHPNESCLSFASGGFRCFRVKI